MLDHYKNHFETYGLLAAEIAGVTRDHMTRYAKARNWKKPSSEDINRKLATMIISKG